MRFVKRRELYHCANNESVQHRNGNDGERYGPLDLELHRL
jgi:hypothetical protein